MSASTENPSAAVALSEFRQDPSASLDDSAIGNGIANQTPLARELFPNAYVIVANSLANTLIQEIARSQSGQSKPGRRTEVRAAVWAAIKVALAATTLSTHQQNRVLGALRGQLLAPWQRTSALSAMHDGWFDERASHYLRAVDARDPMTCAVRIVEALMQALEMPLKARALQTRLLAGLIGHRIVSDTCLFNDWSAQGKLRSLPNLA